MSGDDPESVFVAEVREHFSFLGSIWAFEWCGLLPNGVGDPREAELRVRYRNATNTVDLVSSLTRGLGLDVATRDLSAGPSDCQRAGIPPFVDYERFLLARHSSELKPPLPGMRPHRVFVTMYSQQPIRYTRVVSANLARAVSVMAVRFHKYGADLLSADLDLIWRETRQVSSRKPPSNRWRHPHRG